MFCFLCGDQYEFVRYAVLGHAPARSAPIFTATGDDGNMISPEASWENKTNNSNNSKTLVSREQRVQRQYRSAMMHLKNRMTPLTIGKRKSRKHSKQGGKSKSSKVRKGLNTSAIKKRDGESRKHKRDKEKTKNKSRISKSKDRPLPSSSSASSSFTSGSSDLSASDVDYNSDHNLNPNVEHMKVCSCLQYWWGD